MGSKKAHAFRGFEPLATLSGLPTSSRQATSGATAGGNGRRSMTGDAMGQSCPLKTELIL